MIFSFISDTGSRADVADRFRTGADALGRYLHVRKTRQEPRRAEREDGGSAKAIPSSLFLLRSSGLGRSQHLARISA